MQVFVLFFVVAFNWNITAAAHAMNIFWGNSQILVQMRISYATPTYPQNLLSHLLTCGSCCQWQTGWAVTAVAKVQLQDAARWFGYFVSNWTVTSCQVQGVTSGWQNLSSTGGYLRVTKLVKYRGLPQGDKTIISKCTFLKSSLYNICKPFLKSVYKISSYTQT